MSGARFRGRLFGPGLAGAGAAASAEWQAETLAVAAEGMTVQVEERAVRIEASGFNLRQLRLSWHAQEGEFAFFIDDEQDCAHFLAAAPASLVAVATRAGRNMGRVDSRFRAALLVYGLILALPVILLALFLINTDRLAGWVAAKVPPSYEEKIGDLVLAQTRARTRLVESGAAYDAVSRIGARLTAGSRYRYRWFVAEQQDVNAFAAPGGVIVVHAGLIRKAARAEELAGVLAHEVAHVEQRHAFKGLLKNAGFGVLLSLALGDWSGSALGGWVSTFTELKFSRDAEMQADTDGVRRLAHAEIAPRYMADFFGRLAQEEGKAAQALSMLATHPSSGERMAALQRQLAALPSRSYPPLPVDWAAVQASLSSAGKVQ